MPNVGDLWYTLGWRIKALLDKLWRCTKWSIEKKQLKPLIVYRGGQSQGPELSPQRGELASSVVVVFQTHTTETL